MNRLGDTGVHTLGDTSAFVNPVSRLLLTGRGKTRMDGVGIVLEFYIAPLLVNVLASLILQKYCCATSVEQKRSLKTRGLL